MAGEAISDEVVVIPELVLELADMKVGHLQKDKAIGKLAEEWNKA